MTRIPTPGIIPRLFALWACFLTIVSIAPSSETLQTAEEVAVIRLQIAADPAIATAAETLVLLVFILDPPTTGLLLLLLVPMTADLATLTAMTADTAVAVAAATMTNASLQDTARGMIGLNLAVLFCLIIYSVWDMVAACFSWVLCSFRFCGLYSWVCNWAFLEKEKMQ
jgi:hypothetical protein